MRAVAFISFDGFYAFSLAQANPAWGRSPLVVLHAHTVLDSSPEARRAGILPEMTSQEARYAARGCSEPAVFVEYKEDDYLPASRGFLDVCKGFASAVEPVASHQAFLDLGNLASVRDLTFQLSADLYSSVRLCPRIGLAETMLVARLASETGEVVPPGSDRKFIASLPIEKLWPANARVLARLRHLGYRTIGEVAALPRDVLRGQFGDEGDRIVEWSNGKDRRVVQSAYPPDELYARFSFPQPARLDGELEPALHKLSALLARQLELRDRQSAEIELELLFDDGFRRVARREFLHPMQSEGSLITGLRLTLRRIKIDREVHSIHARLLKIKRPDQKQFDLTRSRQEENRANLVLKRLQANYGSESIKRAAELETPRRDLLLRAWKEATGWKG